MQRPPEKLWTGVSTLVRLGLAAMWLVSGAIKISNPGQTYVAVQAYDVLPTSLVDPAATALPLVELALGIFLLVGLATRTAGAVSGFVVLVLIAAIAQAWARDLSIDCGCFGGGGPVAQGETNYPLEILRDVGFLILAGWLLIRPRSFVSVDGWLRAGRQQRQASELDDERTDGPGTAGRAVGEGNR